MNSAALSSLGFFIRRKVAMPAVALTIGAMGAQAADLTLNISDTGFDPIPAGGVIEYKVRIDNSGNSRTAADTIEFMIPDGATYTGTTGALTGCTPAAPAEGPETISCAVPDMAPRERLESIVEVIPAQDGFIELEAHITGQGVSNTERTTVNKGADLELGFAAPASIQGGEILEFTATITNHGPDTNTGGKFSVTLPEALSGDIELPSDCAIDGRQVTCTLKEEIPVGDSVSFPFSSQILTDNESTVTISGSVTEAAPGDPVSTNDTDKFDVTVEPGTDVTLRKERQPSGLLHVGKEVIFTLTPDFSGTVPLEASIIDELPSNYELISVDAPGAGWNCSSTNPVDCSYSSDSADAAGFRTPITITARAVEETTAGNPVENIAEIGFPDDVRPGNNTASDGGADIVEPFTDLVAHKSGPARGLVTVGNEYDWQIWASNDGAKANIDFAGRLILTEIIPEGLTVTNISAPSGWVCEDLASPLAGSAKISCFTDNYTESDPLAVGAETPRLTITALVTEEGNITNRARVSDENPNYPDADLSNNETSSGVTSGAGDTVGIADLSLEKKVTSTGQYESGDPVKFAIKVINSGPDMAENVVLTDRLNDLYFADDTTTGVTLDNVPVGMSCTVTRGGGFYSDLRCEIDELPVCSNEDDDCPVLSFTAMAGGNAGTKQNSAEVYSTKTPDPNSGNNTSSATYEVEARTDVKIEKTASHPAGGEIHAGHEVIYTLSAIVPKNGLSAADGVTVTDHLPAGLRIVDFDPSTGSCGPVSGIVDGLTTNGSTIDCNLGRIANGNQQTVTIYAVPSTSLVGSTITNNVEVSTSTVELNDDNNTDEISHHIIAPSIDLITNKTDSEDPVVVGGTTVYTVTVLNNGPSEAFDLEITDILPTGGLSFQGVTPITDGLTCIPNEASVGEVGGKLICSMANLPVGDTAEFHVEMEAKERGRWINRAEARSAEDAYEVVKPNNDVDETTTIYELVDLEVIKEASPDNVDLNQPFDWIITVRNLNDPGGLAENVELTDTLPENMEIIGPVTSTAGNCDGQGRNLICILDDMERGDEITITVPARVTAISGSPKTLTNSATVTTDSFEHDSSNNTTSGDVEVRASTVSGMIWRDFNDDGDRHSDHDNGIAGITVQLTGTDKWGDPVSASTTTGADGSYSFELLPPGAYRVSYTNPDETLYETGRAIPGGVGGGSAEGETVIANITATTDDPSEDNDFTLIPQARIALAKQVSEPAFQDDGSYQLTYTFSIKNESQEPVSGFTLSDDLVTDFGSYTDGTPDHGEFTIASISGATSTGQTDAELTFTSASPLAEGDSRTITMVLHVNPELPRTAESLTFTNKAEITGTGDWSGQTPSDGSNDGSNPQHGVTSNTSRDVIFAPEITLEKTATLEKTGATAAPGDQIKYTFVVKNTGNTPLTEIEIEDELDGLVWDSKGPIDRLNPNKEDGTTFTAHYILTQGDIEAGGVDNTATASGRWAVDGVTDPITTGSDTASIDALAAPGLTVVKTEASNTVQNPTEIGDTIRYSFTVTNTGNVDLKDLVLTDQLDDVMPDPAESFDIGTLARAGEPGDSVTFHAEYSVTQGDIDAGKVINRATVNGTYGKDDLPIEESSNEVETPLYQQPEMRVTKVLDGNEPTAPKADDEISWTITIENTGNTTLDIGSIHEPLANTTISAPVPATLPPGETATATATHTLSQEEIDAGQVTNQVTVPGKVPGSETPFDDTPSGNDPDDPNEDETVTPLPAKPSIALLKELVTDVSAPLMPGDEIEFAFTIRNTGNVTLDNIVLTDEIPDVSLDTAILAGDSLAPDTEITISGIYELTAEDIEAGGLENTATVTGDDPHGTEVDDVSGTDFDNDDPTPVELARNPQIALIKTISSAPDAPVEAGDVVEYAFEIRNTGNVELRDISLTELVGGVSVEGNRTAPLPVGKADTSSFTGRYTLTQADIDAGVFANSAEVTATGTGPDGTPTEVTDISGTDLSNDDPTELTIPVQPGLSIVKQADDSAISEPAAVDEMITYSFTVTNTGNVTLSEVTVDDPRLGGAFPDNTIASLAPGTHQVLTADYAITQADIEAGVVLNTATVTGDYFDPDTGGPQTMPPVPSEEIAVPLDQDPRLAVVKLADSDISDPAKPGQDITYRFTVINTGNVTLKGVVLVDPLAGLSAGRFDIGDMLPGAEEVREATYTITQADIDAGEVRNQATVTGTFDDKPVTDLSGPEPETDEETVVPVSQDPGLALLKSADASDLTDPAVVGQEIAYSFTVTNTGNVTLRDLVITDPLTGLEPGSFELAELVPGQDVTVGPAIYKITQADINAGKVENRASASGDYGPTDDPQKIEAPSTNDEGVDGPTVTPVSGEPSIALVKALDPGVDAESLGLGDEVRWVFSVHNTGNVPLENIVIEEQLIDATVSGGPISLDPGRADDTSFTASYRITQADLDAGRIENSARVTGVFDNGSGAPEEVEDISGTTVEDDDPTVTLLRQRPAIDLVKTADASGLSSPPQEGDEIRYSFTITNTGKVTLTDVIVTDPMPDLDLTGAPIPSLAPGDVNDTAYSAVYRLTQADIDSGKSLENQAEVTGTYTDPTDGPQDVTDLSGTETRTDTPTLVEIAREPGLELEKTADDSAITEPAKPGQEIAYSFTITNTGNVTLTDVTVIDPLPGLVLSGDPIASLAPGETSEAITGIYPLTTEDIIATERANTARAEGIWTPEDSPAETVPSNESTVTIDIGYPEIDFDITIGELRDLNGDGRMGPGDEVVFRFQVHNTGTVPLHEVNVDGDTLSVPLPGLICTPITLAVGESAFLTCSGAAHIITDEDAERGEIAQRGDATGVSDVGVVVRATSEASTVTKIGKGAFALEKLALVETAMVGDLVPYEIRISSDAQGVPVSAELVDTLPEGFTYKADSARLDGVAVDLKVNGRNIVLKPLDIEPGQERVLRLEARVGSSVLPGSHVNRVRLLSGTTGLPLAPESEATVRVLADAVLQCATVLGRVFDDTDQNGHMSMAEEERGLPAIRLIAPNGLAITTDEHGRFNVPCAALPQSVGSNFMLKLDERTLPAGYRLTTENPRVVRLTPGMVTRLDFGATLARLVRVDLAANAFDGTDMTPALEAGLAKMVAEIRDQVTMLRLTYVLGAGEPDANATPRLRVVERAITRLWKGEGRYKLNIETMIERMGDAK